MAIVKAVKSMMSTLASLREKIDYCHNPRKVGDIKPDMVGISGDPFKAFMVNKFLHGKDRCRRLYKEYIISMEAGWPEEGNAFRAYQKLMRELSEAAMSWWAERGFQTNASVHCNTRHPHIHLVVDTCNVKSGKQLSQSDRMLADFKDYLSSAMKNLGLGEYVLQKIDVSEEDMCAEDDMDLPRPVGGENDVSDERCEGTGIPEEDAGVGFDGYADPNDPEVFCVPLNSTYVVPFPYALLLEEKDRRRYPRVMAAGVENSAGREMCRIIDNSAGREMCRITDKPAGTLEQRNEN